MSRSQSLPCICHLELAECNRRGCPEDNFVAELIFEAFALAVASPRRIGKDSA